ncbi:HD domain-containing protein [Desulfuromonas sp. AOP6]|uniref:HD domain-containing protein n=1 Tax=Desulfuromonas sp. AOP6 TaxID=1566351 RepID=UPI0012DBF488
MSKIFIVNIRERDFVDSPFLVRDKVMAMAKNGKPYMTLKLVDRTGEVEGRVWDRVDEFNDLFGKDDFIRVKGKASVYLGKMQLVVQEIERLDEDKISLADFLPVSARDAQVMAAELRQKVDSLRNPHLQALLKAFLDDVAFLQAYCKAPAAKSMHHVYLGGLLEHSLAVADLADDICRRYPDLDRDLLVAGALLHDIGKVEELRYVRTFDYTDEGKLLGHIVMGVEMIDEKLRGLENFPRPLALLLKHLLLSHHGQYEYGSPKRPKTMEAVVLNFIDDLDAKINGVRTHIEKEPDSDSAWTSYHRLYDRYFFKPQGLSESVNSSDELQERAAVMAPALSARPETKPKKMDKKPTFGFSLADQLKGKSLDLFAANPDKEDGDDR